MYVIKTKGTAKIPDFIQLRDDNFILVEHCTITNINRILTTNIFLSKFDIEKLHNLPYGKIIKI